MITVNAISIILMSICMIIIGTLIITLVACVIMDLLYSKDDEYIEECDHDSGV